MGKVFKIIVIYAKYGCVTDMINHITESYLFNIHAFNV